MDFSWILCSPLVPAGCQSGCRNLLMAMFPGICSCQSHCNMALWVSPGRGEFRTLRSSCIWALDHTTTHIATENQAHTDRLSCTEIYFSASFLITTFATVFDREIIWVVIEKSKDCFQNNDYRAANFWEWSTDLAKASQPVSPFSRKGRIFTLWRLPGVQTHCSSNCSCTSDARLTIKTMKRQHEILKVSM